MVSIQIVSGLPRPAYAVSRPLSRLGITKLVDLPSASLVTWINHLFNGLHLPVFAVLAFIWCWAVHPWPSTRRIRLFTALSICLAFAGLNELSQIAIPSRWATIWDALANVAGVTLGGVLFLALDRPPNIEQPGYEPRSEASAP